jgi:heme-degrading monooxygenase HmoA
MEGQHYYAVIFSSTLNEENPDYSHMADKMEALAQTMPGFLGFESARGSNLKGISVSYWQTQQDILHWKTQSEHLLAQQLGKTNWYKNYQVKICRVERAYEFNKQ